MSNYPFQDNKRIDGFNLVELMVAIAIGASIVSAIFYSYSNLLGGYLFNNTKIDTEQSLKLAFRIIKYDLQNAGVFGSFSLHNESTTMYTPIGISCADEWCSLDTTTSGIKGLTAVPSGSGITGLSSEILRIQYGSNKVNYLTNIDSNGSFIDSMQFTNNDIISAQAYILAAANHLYLLNLNNIITPIITNSSITFNNMFSSGYSIPIESYANGVIYDPDQSSLQLMNLRTKYYFVANINGESGLYVVEYNGGSLSAPILVSEPITNLSLKYIVDTTANPNFNNSPVNNTYVVCTTNDMNSDSRCLNRWNQVVTVEVTLSAEVSKGDNNFSQRMSDSVGWFR